MAILNNPLKLNRHTVQFIVLLLDNILKTTLDCKTLDIELEKNIRQLQNGQA